MVAYPILFDWDILIMLGFIFVAILYLDYPWTLRDRLLPYILFASIHQFLSFSYRPSVNAAPSRSVLHVLSKLSVTSLARPWVLRMSASTLSWTSSSGQRYDPHRQTIYDDSLPIWYLRISLYRCWTSSPSRHHTPPSHWNPRYHSFSIRMTSLPQSTAPLHPMLISIFSSRLDGSPSSHWIVQHCVILLFHPPSHHHAFALSLHSHLYLLLVCLCV